MSFEELGLPAAIVEALAAEGMESPTELQESAVPIVRRGNNAILEAGPGAGTLVAYGAALLDRIEPGGGTPAALVITAAEETAERLAASLARLAEATGHAVSACDGRWVLPERADVLFGTAEQLLGRLERGDLSAAAVATVVATELSLQAAEGSLARTERVLSFVPDGQRIAVGLPLGEEALDFVQRKVKRAAHLPPRPVDGERSTVRRGDVRFRIVSEPKEPHVLTLVSELLGSGARHVLIFLRNDDVAADAGEYLALRGYRSGPPGRENVPVWLAADELATLAALQESDVDAEGIACVSGDVPADPDALDRRHGRGIGGTVLVSSREVPHLRALAARTGYRLKPAPPAPAEPSGDLARTLAAVVEATEDADVDVYLQALTPLLESHDPALLAAGALALLRAKQPPADSATKPTPEAGKAPRAWVRLFVSIGERDDVRPGDLLGAIVGESGIDASQVGKIDLKDTFSLVEIEEQVAERVIESLNGTTVRGRATRVDYDRGRGRSQTQKRRKRS